MAQGSDDLSTLPLIVAFKRRLNQSRGRALKDELRLSKIDEENAEIEEESTVAEVLELTEGIYGTCTHTFNF